MNMVRAILAVAVALMWVPEAQATRIACVGSNGERILAQAALTAPADGQLEAALQRIAETTGSRLLEVEIVTPPATDEFTIEGGPFLVTVVQVRGSSHVVATAERACESSSAEGWQELWKVTLTQLQQRGYTLQTG